MKAERFAARAHTVRIGISGSYGGLNLGDEAILHVILDELRATGHMDVTVFSRDTEDTRHRHHVERVLELRRTPRCDAKQVISSLDLFILGGGGILFDSDADMYLREVFQAHEVGTPVEHFAFSVGMRLHFLIFSALSGVPFVSLPYAAKVSGFVEGCKMPHRALEHMSAGELIANIDRAWDEREQVRARVREALRELQARARTNTTLAMSVLASRTTAIKAGGASAGAVQNVNE